MRQEQRGASALRAYGGVACVSYAMRMHRHESFHQNGRAWGAGSATARPQYLRTNGLVSRVPRADGWVERQSVVGGERMISFTSLPVSFYSACTACVRPERARRWAERAARRETGEMSSVAAEGAWRGGRAYVERRRCGSMGKLRTASRLVARLTRRET